MNLILAIFKRNFFSYFANPTGYVFICGFVLVSGFAAFWTHEFFNANLANLDQLNKYLPFIMLGFVPAITMSIWAEERRQGTDELLLTLPASDLHVVLGKYLAAVAIFTVSLAFSAAANIFVLARLGEPDVGLLFATILGYWFVGIAMLAIGMVASFLTANLTVGFVLGVALNAPLVFAATADVIISDTAFVQSVRQWSISAMFADFARGVISLASIAYFLSLVAIGLYLSMILIGRRHWVTGSKGGSLALHFAVRAFAVLAVAIGLSFIFRIHDARVDASSEKLSSLSPRSIELLSTLGDRRMTIEAFISPESLVPEPYIQTRLNLLNMLNEIQKQSKGKVRVNVFETESFKRERDIALQRYNITPRPVFMKDRGQHKQFEIFMGVAILSGLDKSVIEFVDRGVPTEYELISRIVTLAREKRKTIGVVKTDAPLMGQMNMRSPVPPEGEELIRELKRRYEVLEIDASAPIMTHCDALLVVQPSSLEQRQLENLMEAIRRGIPTAIFEDPVPVLPYGDRRSPVPPPPGTLDPRRPPQMDPMMASFNIRPPMPGPKGRIDELWQLLGCAPMVRTVKAGDPPSDTEVVDVVWQDFNPFPRVGDVISNEIIFIGKSGGKLAQNDDITRGLQYVMFPYAGRIVHFADTALDSADYEDSSKFLTGKPSAEARLTIRPLAVTGGPAGLVNTRELEQMSREGKRIKRESSTEVYMTAARIQGRRNAADPMMHAVIVADIDVLSSFFFGHRNQGENEQMPFYFDVDNVPFVLNIIDSLAGEDAFFEIRSRRRAHRTLTAFEKSTEEARLRTIEEEKKAEDELDAKLESLNAQFRQRIVDLAKDRRAGAIDDRQFQIKSSAANAQLQRVLTVEQVRLTNIRDEEVKRAQSELELSIRQIQNTEKRLAVFIPPILPLFIALVVFGWRRSRELEGAVRSRVR